MNSKNTPDVASKLIIRGIHLGLTEAMKAAIEDKVERLLRHEPRIIRVRIDVDTAHQNGTTAFTAKGHIEIGGPDLIVSVTTDDGYKAMDELMDKLDRQLRKRSTALHNRRPGDDIRAFEPPEAT